MSFFDEEGEPLARPATSGRMPPPPSRRSQRVQNGPNKQPDASSRTDAEVIEYLIALAAIIISSIAFNKWTEKKRKLIRYGLATVVGVGNNYAMQALAKRYGPNKA